MPRRYDFCGAFLYEATDIFYGAGSYIFHKFVVTIEELIIMKNIFQPAARILACLCLVMAITQPSMAQSTMPEIMDTASIESQLIYLQERTRIYNDYRAIRNDIFLRMKKNVMDTLVDTRLEIAHLNSRLTERNFQIETLNTDLARVKNDRDQAIRTKDSFSFFGMQMNKILYSTVMWIIILGLALLAVILVLWFKRNLVVTVQTKKELKNTLEEFDTYRKNSREKHEKLVVAHHKEVMKLKRS